MEHDFEGIEQALQAGGPSAGLDLLAQKFIDDKNYPLLFEARLVKKRHELGLPLIQIESSSEDMPADKRRLYDEAFIEAAREVGGLFLADGNIPRAWPYLRAIGDTAPVVAAIEQVQPAEGIEPVIEIAFQERVHPRKGFELILANYGICRAITTFEQYPSREGREDCLRLLVRTLHSELVSSLKRTIAQTDGQAPDTESVSELIADREWLFGDYNYYVDTSHLVSILRYSLELNDPETLKLAVELSDYGKRLAAMFHYKGDPPFENAYTDHAIYLRALLGENVDLAIAHFRDKVAAGDPNEVGSGPAQVLVDLMTRLKRYPEAIAASVEYLREINPAQLACPSAFQLCQMAGDYDQLMRLAREQGDVLSFAAAAIQK